MADVTIEASAAVTTCRILRPIVFTTASIGYWFYFDSDGTFGYSKTTDGGASWGAQVEISAGTPHIAASVWFDQWTPGDSGTLIHTWYFDTATDTVRWRSLDTNGDTLGTARVAFTGATAVAVRNAFCSGTKTRSGYLYVAFDLDAGAEHGLVRSTDGGTNWSANLSAAFVIDTGASQLDQCICFPATGTGDNNDMWAVYQDNSADALTMKMWDSSAAAEVESSTIQTMVENATDQTGQMGFAASIRHSDGAIIIASCSEMDTSTADMQVWEVTAVNAGSLTGVTQKTDITTNKAEIYYPSVFIDQNSDDIYVAYNGKRDGSETLATATKVYYTKSTDGGTSWSAGDTAYMEGTAGVVIQVWTPLMGPRFYVAWRVTTTLLGNFVNSLTFAAGPLTQSLSGALSFVGADAFRTNKGLVASLSFAGAAAKRMSRGLAGSLSFIGSLAAAKLFIRALTATLSFVGAQKDTTAKALSGSLSFAGATARSVAHKMTAALSFVGATSKRLAHALAGALSFVGTFTRGSIFMRAFTASLTFAGAQSRSTRKAVTAALSFVGASSKRLARSLAGALSFVGTFRKTSGKAMSASLSFAGTIKRAIAHKMTAALTWGVNFASQLVGGPVQFTKSLVASLSFSTAQAKGTRKGMAAALSFVGAARKRGTRALTGALAFVGSMAAKNVFTRAFTATLSFIGAQSKRIPMRLESALSFVGNVVGGIIGLGGIFRNRRGSRGVNA